MTRETQRWLRPQPKRKGSESESVPDSETFGIPFARSSKSLLPGEVLELQGATGNGQAETLLPGERPMAVASVDSALDQVNPR